MIHKTRGIVLHKIKYSETSIIVHIYTEKFGRLPFLIKGAARKNSKIKSAIFQPLVLLQTDIYHKSNKNLQSIKEVKIEPVLNSISTNIIKSSIALFIAEILYKTLKEETPNDQMYTFISNTIQILDIQDHELSNFHLKFLINYSKYLGFFPNNNYTLISPIFDLLNGTFIQTKPHHNHFIDKKLSAIFHELLNNQSYQNSLSISNINRFELLEKIVEYYKIHLEGFGDIKSIYILKNVFH